MVLGESSAEPPLAVFLRLRDGLDQRLRLADAGRRGGWQCPVPRRAELLLVLQCGGLGERGVQQAGGGRGQQDAGGLTGVVPDDLATRRIHASRGLTTFDMPMADPSPMRLAEEMPKLAKAWDEIVELHGLEPFTLDDLIGGAWQFADHAFAYGQEHPPDRIVMSPIKVRQAGFSGCFDTEDSILYWLTRMQEKRILPRR